MKKIWKQVKGHNYLVSNYGEVKSVKRNKNLTPRKTDKGYLTVLLYYENGKDCKSYRIHRLVLSTFHDVDYTTFHLECNHIDEDKKNNRLDNLTWVTRKENMNWNGLSERIKRNTVINKDWVKMITAHNSKEIIGTNLKTNKKVHFKSIADARRNGFNAGNISACCLGKRKKHKGYIWKYK